MPLLIELTVDGLKYAVADSNAALIPDLVVWARSIPEDKRDRILYRWLMAFSEDSQPFRDMLLRCYPDTSAVIIIPDTPTGRLATDEINVDLSTFVPSPRTLEVIAANELSRVIVAGTIRISGGPLLHLMADACSDTAIERLLNEPGYTHLGVRLVARGSGLFQFECGVYTDVDRVVLLAGIKSDKTKRKIFREIARVKRGYGSLPNRMTDEAFLGALVKNQRQPKGKPDHRLVEWLRSAREASRRVDDETFKPQRESLNSWAYNRYERGTNPRCLPEKLARPGEMVGVELEFIPLCDDEGRGTGFSYPRIFGLDFCYDGSVKDPDHPDMECDNECRILMRFGNFQRLHAVCKTFEKEGCFVNETCGVHVHLDARDIQKDIDQVMMRACRLRDALPLLSGFVNYGRLVGYRAERYCQLGISPSFGSGDHYDPDRYYAVNMCAFEERGTVEVRLYQGSVNAQEVEGWVRLLRFIFRGDFPIPSTPLELLAVPGLADSLSPCGDFLLRPWSAFNAATADRLLANRGVAIPVPRSSRRSVPDLVEPAPPVPRPRRSTRTSRVSGEDQAPAMVQPLPIFWEGIPPYSRDIWATPPAAIDATLTGTATHATVDAEFLSLDAAFSSVDEQRAIEIEEQDYLALLASIVGSQPSA